MQIAPPPAFPKLWFPLRRAGTPLPQAKRLSAQERVARTPALPLPQALVVMKRMRGKQSHFPFNCTALKRNQNRSLKYKTPLKTQTGRNTASIAPLTNGPWSIADPVSYAPVFFFT